MKILVNRSILSMMTVEVRKLEGGYVNGGVWQVGEMVVKRIKSINPGVVVADDERYWNELRIMIQSDGRLTPKLLAHCPYGRLIFMERLNGDNTRVLLKRLREIAPCLGEMGREDIETVKERIYFGRGAFIRSWYETMRVEGGMTGTEYFTKVEGKAWRDMEIFANSGLPEAAGIDGIKIGRVLRERALPMAKAVVENYDSLIRPHGDWWSDNNIIVVKDGVVEGMRAFDAEFSDKEGGVREEDLAQEFMWERRRNGLEGLDMWEAFERGYGQKIDLVALMPFELFKLLDYLEGASVAEWRSEGGGRDGFWTETLRLLTEVLVELESQ